MPIQLEDGRPAKGGYGVRPPPMKVRKYTYYGMKMEEDSHLTTKPTVCLLAWRVGVHSLPESS